MKNNNYKTKIKVNYSIDKIIIENFDILSNKKAINKSKLVGQLIEQWTNENSKEN